MRRTRGSEPAGVLPPLEREELMLADGAYVDLAPVDLAREHAPEVVIAVDAGQSVEATGIRNGFQAIMRAMDICHRKHAQLRFAQADLVLRPLFRRDIDRLDFGARRDGVTAGIRTIRAEIETIRRVLAPSGPTPPQRNGRASDDEAGAHEPARPGCRDRISDSRDPRVFVAAPGRPGPRLRGRSRSRVLRGRDRGLCA